ncbi:MAG: DUF305 domain-containing protein [Hamadaea sp.]|nr:DUF305 domain-containing protein [Hamadaea sp.]
MPPRALAGLALGCLFLLSACGSPPADPATVRPDATAADTAFVRGMLAYHQHNLAVLALADTRATDREVKMIAERTAGLQRLQQSTMTTLLIGWAQPTHVPATEPDTHATELSDLSGIAFDRGLLVAMISHNEDAVAVARNALGGDLSERARGIAASVDSGMSAENAALHRILTRLSPAVSAPR